MTRLAREIEQSIREEKKTDEYPALIAEKLAIATAKVGRKGREDETIQFRYGAVRGSARKV